MERWLAWCCSAVGDPTVAGAFVAAARRSSGPCPGGSFVLTQVVVGHSVDRDPVVAVGRAASYLTRVGTSRRRVLEHSAWIRGVEQQVVSRKRCSFR